ncbi:MAG TPA: hypothetical protein PLV06_06035 [Bacteroidales bacterium]|nr:hypothetical protein [Bacteroidales bacterium]HPF04144.1 hypothetical protein [Bacteroidales bacterium]HPJ58777.1 hypothetical protein [Bacteroidales bacterium]HPR11927.1 hypothetical protein [Bacteroidales bacterium]HRW85374.1 hypothetical protein [Bacteroidales bacterium]
MYTFDDYQKDLSITEALGLKPDGPGNKVLCTESEYLSNELPYATADYKVNIGEGPQTLGEIEDKKGTISGINLQYLKRSYFDRRKFKSTLKSEMSLDENDDFSGPFIGLWTQLEFEYRKRLYDAFIPESLVVIINILRGAGQLKDNCIENIAESNMPATFGLVNEVIYAIEKGFKTGEKRVGFLLTKIFEGSHLSFFREYSIHKSMERFNREIRNVVMHENRFLSQGSYREACLLLFRKPGIREWCNADGKCLFTDYLKILPESSEEKYISGLETMIKKVKLSPVSGPSEADIEKLEKELQNKQRELCLI